MRARLFLAFLLLLAPLPAMGPAAAQPAGGAQPLDRLLPQIRRNVPGQFLDAEGATSGGNPHYHLKWLTPDGRVMWLDTDARTGRVLGRSPGRDGFDGPPRFGGENGQDRSDEGRGSYQRYDRQPRFGGSDRQYAPYGNGRLGGRDFGGYGGGYGGRPERGFGNRNFGGGHDRGHGR